MTTLLALVPPGQAMSQGWAMIELSPGERPAPVTEFPRRTHGGWQ
jgi:hypothetical protein